MISHEGCASTSYWCNLSDGTKIDIKGQPDMYVFTPLHTKNHTTYEFIIDGTRHGVPEWKLIGENQVFETIMREDFEAKCLSTLPKMIQNDYRDFLKKRKIG